MECWLAGWMAAWAWLGARPIGGASVSGMKQQPRAALISALRRALGSSLRKERVRWCHLELLAQSHELP